MQSGNSLFIRHGCQDWVCRYTKWRLGIKEQNGTITMYKTVANSSIGRAVNCVFVPAVHFIYIQFTDQRNSVCKIQYN